MENDSPLIHAAFATCFVMFLATGTWKEWKKYQGIFLAGALLLMFAMWDLQS